MFSGLRDQKAARPVSSESSSSSSERRDSDWTGTSKPPADTLIHKTSVEALTNENPIQCSEKSGRPDDPALHDSREHGEDHGVDLETGSDHPKRPRQFTLRRHRFMILVVISGIISFGFVVWLVIKPGLDQSNHLVNSLGSSGQLPSSYVNSIISSLHGETTSESSTASAR